MIVQDAGGRQEECVGAGHFWFQLEYFCHTESNHAVLLSFGFDLFEQLKLDLICSNDEFTTGLVMDMVLGIRYSSSFP